MPMPYVSTPSELPRAVMPQRQVRAALRAGQMVLHYQPVVALAGGRVRGVEALVRWQHQADLLLMPDDFLPAVSHTPVMHEVTEWVIREACVQAARWDLPTMSVNIAAVDVVRPSLVTVISSALRANGLGPERLVVELTEHAAVQGMSAAADVLRDLRRLGVGVALDDFGTGYSSLLYLRDLPITEVKVDRTFVSGVDRNDDDAAIVRSVVQLARTVGLSVVAEGVETLTQARFLMSIGCDCAQGYLYGQPSRAADVPLQVDPSLLVTNTNGSAPPARRRSRNGTTSPSIAAQQRMVALVDDGASLHTIAAALNREGHTTAAGTRWTAATVARTLSDVSPT
jgi:EAL domain-containing protein (putative c-di-GMP-specific phosphodiesterase class I)